MREEQVKRPAPRPVENNAIDLGSIEDYLECIKGYFFQLLLVLMIVASLVTVYFNYFYSPSYSARITYAVNKSGDSSIDASLASRLSRSVTTLTSLKEFKEDLLENVDPDTRNNSFRFSSVYTDQSNLFTITIDSNNYDNTNFILHRFRGIYPNWAYESNGNLRLEEVDVSEATRIPSNEYSLIRSLGYGALAGLVVCAGLVVLYAMMLHTVRKESDMKTITGKSCLVQVPEIKIKKRGKSNNRQLLLLSNKHIDWKYRQALQTVQTRIFQQMEKNGQKVLMVASSIPQEGKTSIAVNIALGCVSQRKRTLLLDGDLRNPSVLKTFGSTVITQGLTDYLNGEAELEDIIARSSHLSVITAGSGKAGLSSVIQEDKMEALFAYLRSSYDCIIIDTPPSALFSDGALMAEYADQVVYVVRCNKATIEQVKEGIAPYIQNEKLMGYIFNRAAGGVLGYGRYGSYGYSRSYRYGYGSYGYTKYQKTMDIDFSSLDKKPYENVDLEQTEMNSEDSL